MILVFPLDAGNVLKHFIPKKGVYMPGFELIPYDDLPALEASLEEANRKSTETGKLLDDARANREAIREDRSQLNQKIAGLRQECVVCNVG